MNRYVIDGLHQQAYIHGKSVLVICRRDAIPDILIRITNAATAVTVNHRNGAESITFPTGGSIRFASSEAAIRGHAVDIVFVDHTHGHDRLLRESADAAALPDGEVIRA